MSVDIKRKEGNPTLDYTRRSDEELIAQCLAPGEGAQEAFHELHRRYYGMVQRICRAVLPSAEDAEDASQETFIRAFLALGRFRYEASFGTWLARIAENTALNVKRSQRTHVSLDEVEGGAEDPVSLAESREFSQRVRQAIQMLPTAPRALIILRELEGRDYAEIARQRGCSVGTVRSQLHEARRLLRRNLRLLLEPSDLPPERSTPMTDCPTIRDRLAAFAAKELTRKAREKVEDHLAECPSCAAALEALKAGVPGPVQHAERQWKSVWDDLTGLLTSKTFVDRLNEEVERARRYGRTLGLVYLDIDFFKRLNDTYGLMAGDRVLVSLAHLIGAHSRAGDVPCRYGGEHFVLLLPETSVDGPRIVAERLRQATEEMAVPSDDGPPISLSVSAGIAVYPYEGGTAEELLERADQALRRAKMEGRNRVVQLPRRGDHKADPEAPAFAREKRVIGFGDLSHFFVGASQRDNLAVAAALQEFYEQMDQRVEGHGGRVVKFIGDALLFCFPAGGERDAVACSREMVEAVRSGLAGDWGLGQMSLGIGLNTGEVVAGEFGPAGRRTFDVFGDSVNVASLIGRGEGIKITEAVRSALGGNVQVEAVEPLRRGGREISIYRVV